jgi:hypothetical protein
MDGYTWWISEYDDYVDGIENEEGEDNNDKGPEEGWTKEAPRHEEEAGHREDDEHGEDKDMQALLLTLVVQDPHVQDLLHKVTINIRAASRDKSKLTKIELDSKTPLYAGCDPKESFLKVTLILM